MVTSYDAPARPQHWQLHKEQGVGVHFIAFYTNKSKLSDVGMKDADVAQFVDDAQKSQGIFIAAPKAATADDLAAIYRSAL